MRAIRIGSLELGDVPRIAVPLTDDDPGGDMRAVARLADIVELRIDAFSSLDIEHVRGVVEAVRGASPETPIIATVRAAEEGGQKELPDAERLALYGAVMPSVDAVDIELRASLRDQVIAAAHSAARLAIVSHHDFAATPGAAALDAIHDAARDAGADIVKVAAAPRHREDLLHLLEFTLRHRRQPLVTMAVGELGTISRVFFPLAGSRITFGFHRAASAPGQMPVAELRRELERYYPGFRRSAQEPGKARG